MIMLVSLVFSVYNEETVLEGLYQEVSRVLASLDVLSEMIFVDDGSTDASRVVLQSIFQQDKRVKLIYFSRNFGHESAMLAGIAHSRGDLIICMDADLQHPPSKIPEIIAAYREGYEVISLVRHGDEGRSFLRKWMTRMFYRLLNALSEFRFEPNASDFFAISRRVANIILTQFNVRNRFLRGFIQQVGFKSTFLTYEAPRRKEGKSKYRLTTLFLFSVAALVANSRAPLRFSIFISFLFGMFSIVLAVYSLVMKIVGNPFSGYTTLVVFMSLAFSLLFFVLGVMGEYIGNIYHEIKQLPLYVIDSIQSHEPLNE